jgi:hypothetical protein
LVPAFVLPARLANDLKGAGRKYLQPGRPHPLDLLAEEHKAEETHRTKSLCPTCSITPPYFAVEAKRLHVSLPSGWQSLVAEYVGGNQGMMCFITGRYRNTQRLQRFPAF